MFLSLASVKVANFAKDDAICVETNDLFVNSHIVIDVIVKPGHWFAQNTPSMYSNLYVLLKYCQTLKRYVIFSKIYVFSSWLIGGLGWWFGYLGSPYIRDCYLVAPLKSQTTNPNHQFTVD